MLGIRGYPGGSNTKGILLLLGVGYLGTVGTQGFNPEGMYPGGLGISGGLVLGQSYLGGSAFPSGSGTWD